MFKSFSINTSPVLSNQGRRIRLTSEQPSHAANLQQRRLPLALPPKHRCSPSTRGDGTWRPPPAPPDPPPPGLLIRRRRTRKRRGEKRRRGGEEEGGRCCVHAAGRSGWCCRGGRSPPPSGPWVLGGPGGSRGVSGGTRGESGAPPPALGRARPQPVPRCLPPATMS